MEPIKSWLKLTPVNLNPEIIGHRYQVLSRVGKGMGGEVFKVRGPEGMAALKLLHEKVEGLSNEDRLATFKFEFSLLKGLEHANIVRIFDFGQDEKSLRPYFTQEWLEGRNLETESAWSYEQVRDILIQALQGLAYLHSHDVLHGDLKPENLFLVSNDDGPAQLKLIDFGISRPDLAKSGGTPPYVAPEKILKEDVDARSDLYSLAVTCYSMLAGKNPFHRQNIFATYRAQLHFLPPSIATLRPEVEPAFSALLDSMLAKNPRQRPASAEDALKFLETNGAVAVAPARPRSLPKIFVGRAEVLSEAKEFLAELKAGSASKALLIAAEKGLGAEGLLTELKYEAELQGLELRDLVEGKGEGLAILSADEFRKLGPDLNFAAIATTLSPEESDSALAKLSSFKPKLLRLRPLDLAETEQYLRETTRNAELPPAFVQGLQDFSGGYPDTLRAALESLLQDPLIVDASGKWHLAAYRESVPDFFGLASTETDWEQLLAQERSPERRWELELHQAEAMAKENRLEPARDILNDLEKNLAGLFTRGERLERKPKILELRGWVYARQGRYAEAREDFTIALSLLQESTTPSPALRLRIQNFIAFLDLQEGRTEAAIAEFEANRDKAAELSAADARLVTNNELANAYLAAGRLGEGVAQLKQDLDFFASHPDPFFKMKVAYNLGEALTKDKDYAGAAEAYRRVAETARRERHWDYLIRAYNGLGNLASLLENRSGSLDYYQRSLALAEYRRDFLCAATVAQNRGVILSELGRLDEANRDIELSKRLVAKVHPSSHTRYLMARATLELGEICRKQRDFAAARAYFAEARNRSEEDVHLKSFRFYPLASMAALFLDEGDLEGFRRLAPDLIHLSEGEAEKKALQELLGRAPVDPRSGREEKPASRALKAADHEASDSALSNILKINRALLTERDPRLLFRKILEHAAELCGAETALLLLEDEREGLVVRETFNTELDAGQIEISQQIAHQVLESGNPVVTADAQHDRGFSQFQSVVALHLRSIACVPIRAGLRSVGVLYLTHRFQTDLFNPRILRLLEAFGDQAGLALQNLQNLNRLEEMNAKLKGELDAAEEEIGRLKVDLRGQLKNPYPRILGRSRAIVEILGLLDRVSDTNLSILILGETGSGKELVARSIHEHSRRRQGPFVAVNCGAIPENLMESELFGYKAGAFTGATRDKKGLIEEAHGGTLFLDEIAELPLNTQAKLLRALQEKEIVRLGDTRPMAVDLRVVSATHRRLEEWIAEGKFREDLYYRVAQMVLQLPALRERREDMLLLANHFLEESVAEHRLTKPPRLAREVLALMNGYDWPGNIRELENFIRTSAAFTERGLIRLEAIPAFLRRRLTTPPEAPLRPELPSLAKSIPAAKSDSADLSNWTWERYEEALYGTVLARCGMNCEKAARELKVGVATVYVKARKYDLKAKVENWRHFPSFPLDTTVEGLRRRVILETHRRLNSSAYAVAKQLGLNVGTVYRQLREAAPTSLSN